MTDVLVAFNHSYVITRLHIAAAFHKWHDVFCLAYDKLRIPILCSLPTHCLQTPWSPRFKWNEMKCCMLSCCIVNCLVYSVISISISDVNVIKLLFWRGGSGSIPSWSSLIPMVSRGWSWAICSIIYAWTNRLKTNPHIPLFRFSEVHIIPSARLE